jgi:hypothetical protein
MWEWFYNGYATMCMDDCMFVFDMDLSLHCNNTNTHGNMSPKNKHLLILDGHNFHLMIDVVQTTRIMDLDLIILPSHTFHMTDQWRTLLKKGMHSNVTIWARLLINSYVVPFCGSMLPICCHNMKITMERGKPREQELTIVIYT